MSTSPPTERDQQSFAETALRLGGKTEEEARRTGAVDKADEQVEALFKPQYQTANSPIHKAVWDGQGAARPVRAAAAAAVRTRAIAAMEASLDIVRRHREAGTILRRERQGLADHAARTGRRRLLGHAHRPADTAARARRSLASRTS